MTDLSANDFEQLASAIRAETDRQPPTLAVIGVSGVGKSSVINRMFRTSLPTSHTTACTQKFTATDLQLTMQRGAGRGAEVPLRVIDCPGLGEDMRRDPEFLEDYRQQLPGADVVLYVSAARNRAVALEQHYLTELQEFGSRMVFGLSQSDLVEPRNWNERLNLPSAEQKRHLEEIGRDRSERLGRALGKQIEVIPFSAERGWGLQRLFTALIHSCPQQRAWLFDGLKAFRFSDFVPAAALESLRKSGGCPEL